MTQRMTQQSWDQYHPWEEKCAHAFEGESFEKISTTEIVKKLIKISPKALLKLGKFI